MPRQRSSIKNTTINLICGIGVLIINTLVSFFLSPFIIRTIGVEANGFVNLANNFISYANILVTALNAMAARFVAISYTKGDYKKANLFYNSVFWGNLILVAVLMIPIGILIGRLEHFFNVPDAILKDVKILFGFAFLGFFARTGAPNYDCGTYVKNRLDLSYIPHMVTTVLRAVLLFALFTFFMPHVWYVSLTSAIITISLLFVSGHYTHVLTPELKIQIRKPLCDWKIIWELVGSGIWSSIAIAGNTLMNGLDLLVCNLLIGATSMGVLSISKSLASIMSTYAETIRGVFGPELTLAYANDDKEALLATVRRSMKITAVMVSIPAAGIFVMSKDMYRLWIPSQDAELLSVLTSLAILNYIFSSGIAVLNNVFVTVNKVRYNTYALVITGLTSIGITYLLVRFTGLGLYAVAGVSSVVMIIKNLTFMLPVTSKLLGYKWYQFFPQVGISILCNAIIILIGIGVKHVLPVHSWLMFFAACLIIAVLGLFSNVMIVLSKQERKYLWSVAKRKFGRKSA